MSDCHDNWSQGALKLLARESVIDRSKPPSKACGIMKSVPEEDANDSMNLQEVDVPEIMRDLSEVLNVDPDMPLRQERDSKQHIILDTNGTEEKGDDSGMPENNRIKSAYILRHSQIEKEQNIWTENNKNPDDNLAVLYAANMGFQAKTTGHRGSDFIYYFTKKVKNSISKGETQRLGDICDDIQDKLKRERGQMPKFEFYNTRDIVFGKNDRTTVNVDDMMGSSRYG